MTTVPSGFLRRTPSHIRDSLRDRFTEKHKQAKEDGSLDGPRLAFFEACEESQEAAADLQQIEVWLKAKIQEQLEIGGTRATEGRRWAIAEGTRRYFRYRSDLLEAQLRIDMSWKGRGEWQRLATNASLLTTRDPGEPARSGWQLNALRIMNASPLRRDGSSSTEYSSGEPEDTTFGYLPYPREGADRKRVEFFHGKDVEERPRGRSPTPRQYKPGQGGGKGDEEIPTPPTQASRPRLQNEFEANFRSDLERIRQRTRARSESAVTVYRVSSLDGACDEEDDSPIFLAPAVYQPRKKSDRSTNLSPSKSHPYLTTTSSPRDDVGTGMPSNPGIARQAPAAPTSPQQSNMNSAQAQAQAQQQANGLGAVVTNGLPPAGHQTDINYVWGVVQELSDALQRNREQTAAIVERMHQMGANRGLHREGVAPGENDQLNGDAQGNASAEIASLRSQLHQSQAALAEAQADASSLSSINDEYVTFLHGTMDKIRIYAHEHSKSSIAIHAHYNGLLDQEREANMQLRIEHGNWQAGLGRATEFARLALRERSEEVNGLERKMREARAENMVLRRMVGWEVRDEDSDSEEAAGQRAEPKSRLLQAANTTS